jgi:TolB-like protein/Tfp pilus assembly protein PilF
VQLAHWFQELKRRRVFRALVGYGVVAFAVVQGTEPLIHALHLPEWILSAVVLALGIGFPITVVLAWTFDLKVAGLERTEPPAAHHARPLSRLRLGLLLVGLGAIAAAPGLTYFFLLRRDSAAPTVGAPSIAVLPFVDMSPGRDHEYFSDGIAEEILNALSQIEGLRVAGRTSSFAFKGRNEDLRAIGQKLNVRAVLEGSVRKAGSRVRITAQVVDTADGYHLWSREFDRDLSDVFAVQDEIAKAVASALEVKLLPGRAATAREHLATDPVAYGHYLLGRQLFHLGSPAGYRGAVDAYEKALEIDPRYAPAWAGLAIAANYASSFAESGEELQRLLRRSREAGPKAPQLDPRLAEGFAARGYVRAMMEHDWAGAGEDLERAIALSPRDAEIRRLYSGFVLAPVGRTKEAVEAARLATELDPAAPLCWNALGLTFIEVGEYAKARAALEEAARLNPEMSFAGPNLVKLFVLEGDADRALRVASGIASPGRRLAALAWAHRALGHEDESRRALEALEAEYADRLPYSIAIAHALRGERDEAFRWLDRAAEVSDREMTLQVKVDPFLRSLHGDPRFEALLRRMNLTVD